MADATVVFIDIEKFTAKAGIRQTPLVKSFSDCVRCVLEPTS